jgi:hypothetical protein
MSDSDLTDRISRLEAEIEHLGDVAESCRKIITASKVAIVAGGALLFAMAIGIIPFAALGFIVSVTAVIAGIVASGSNTRTRQQTLEAQKDAETRRSQLIDRINLKVVPDETGKPDRARLESSEGQT